jgi:hypothetical protein
MDLATKRLNEAVKGKKQELKHALVLIGRDGQHFQKAVGKFDQPARVVGQNEILFLAPAPLARK